MKGHWLGIYHHRHGEDFALFREEPTEDKLQEYWKEEYEPERGMDNESGPQDEYFEITFVTFAE
jgi:hypothetical protein